MLSEDEKNYLKKIPPGKRVHISPFDPKTAEAAKEIILSIKKIYPNLEIVHMGASKLGISGQNDLDIYAFSQPSDFKKYLPGIIKTIGNPIHKHKTFIEWGFSKNGFQVQFYLTEKGSPTMQKQIKIFEIFKHNKLLLAEYERLKESLDGKPFRQYQEKKYGFYHLLLDSKKTYKALVFLAKSYNSSGHNPKPVVFHSIKMAINLSNLGYGENVVIISILHDLIEDTEVKYVDIKEKFGKKIADTVLALSFDPEVTDRKKRDKKEIDNAIQFGKDAVIVKAADFIDNSNFYHLTDKKLQQHLIKKYKYFLENSKQIMGNEKIYYLLKKGFENLKHG